MMKFNAAKLEIRLRRVFGRVVLVSASPIPGHNWVHVTVLMSLDHAPNSITFDFKTANEVELDEWLFGHICRYFTKELDENG